MNIFSNSCRNVQHLQTPTLILHYSATIILSFTTRCVIPQNIPKPSHRNPLFHSAVRADWRTTFRDRAFDLDHVPSVGTAASGMETIRRCGPPRKSRNFSNAQHHLYRTSRTICPVPRERREVKKLGSRWASLLDVCFTLLRSPPAVRRYMTPLLLPSGLL